MATFWNHPYFSFYERSITEAGLLNELKDRHLNLSHCFHLAAIVSVPYSVEHPEETLKVNYHATKDLLRGAEELGFTKFIFAGSAAEYGEDRRLPLLEEYATEDTNHVSPYGRAKFCASVAVASSTIGVALRFFNIYGPRQDPKSPYSGVISRFADKALAGKSLTIFGDGLQTRDFVYVSDVVEAYARAASLDGVEFHVPGGVYNIGTGRITSVLDLAQTIKELTGNCEPLLFLEERPGDIRHSLASVDAFRSAARWSAKVSLREGLQRTLYP
jgi:UDP-glucose 4-epimerase